MGAGVGTNAAPARFTLVAHPRYRFTSHAGDPATMTTKRDP
jgi:hypothetical protein